MPAPIVLSTLTPETKKVVNPPAGQPVIATKADLRDGTRAQPPAPLPTGVIFQDNFDAQPDFTSTMHNATRGGSEVWNGGILPDNWDAIFQGTRWSPETGFPDNHASLEILAANASKARGGTGKSMVHWRESWGSGWYFEPITLNAGDLVKVQHMTADTYDTEVVQSLIVGGTTYTFTSRTAASAGAVAPSGEGSNLSAFVTQTGQPVHTRIVSNVIEIQANGTVVQPGPGPLGDFTYSTDGGASWPTTNAWASDSQTIKLLDQEYDEIYFEYWISFSENWDQRLYAGDFSGSKVVRVGYFDGIGDPYNGAAGAVGPMTYWQYLYNNFGMRNTFAFRGGPAGENYYGIDLNGNNIEAQTNYTNDTIGKAVGGGNPQVVDQVNGGILADVDRFDFLSHDRLFGPAGHWTKMAFYVKMNSAPGVADGVLMQWINDERIKVHTTIPWIETNTGSRMVGWNYVALGGNEFYRAYPNAYQFEDWYSIDDFVVMNSIPEGLI